MSFPLAHGVYSKLLDEGMNKHLFKFPALRNDSKKKKKELSKVQQKKYQCITFQGSHSSHHSHSAQTCSES